MADFMPGLATTYRSSFAPKRSSPLARTPATQDSGSKDKAGWRTFLRGNRSRAGISSNTGTGTGTGHGISTGTAHSTSTHAAVSTVGAKRRPRTNDRMRNYSPETVYESPSMPDLSAQARESRFQQLRSTSLTSLAYPDEQIEEDAPPVPTIPQQYLHGQDMASTENADSLSISDSPPQHPELDFGRRIQSMMPDWDYPDDEEPETGVATEVAIYKGRAKVVDIKKSKDAKFAVDIDAHGYEWFHGAKQDLKEVVETAGGVVKENTYPPGFMYTMPGYKANPLETGMEVQGEGRIVVKQCQDFDYESWTIDALRMNPVGRPVKQMQSGRSGQKLKKLL